jgi:hypothetical protein
MGMGGLDQNLPFWEMPFGHPFEGYFFLVKGPLDAGGAQGTLRPIPGGHFEPPPIRFRRATTSL